MRRGGQITGFEQVTKPYDIQYGAAKVFNDSCEHFSFLLSYLASLANGISGRAADVTEELQNVMLQHASINMFVWHYSVGIHVDAQVIVRGLSPKK
jgi:hypothetical protein